MDSALRMALNSGLEEKLDYEVLRGAEGLLTGSKLANHNKSGETTHAQYLSQFCFARVDGRYAAEQSDLKILMGSGSYAHAGSTYQTNPHLSALDALMAKGACSRVGACASRGEHEAKQRDPSRNAFRLRTAFVDGGIHHR